jgi:hypothetical protein
MRNVDQFGRPVEVEPATLDEEYALSDFKFARMYLYIVGASILWGIVSLYFWVRL